MREFFLAHPGWVIVPALLILWGLIELVVALTPTQKDDAVWKVIRSVILALINRIPRKRSGGGYFNK